MTWCEFRTIGEGVYLCDRCGRDKKNVKVLPIHRLCEPVRSSQFCGRLGELMRSEECGDCTSKPKIKVFACALHGECTLGKPLDGLACCATCADYSDTSPPPKQP